MKYNQRVLLAAVSGNISNRQAALFIAAFLSYVLFAIKRENKGQKHGFAAYNKSDSLINVLESELYILGISGKAAKKIIAALIDNIRDSDVLVNYVANDNKTVRKIKSTIWKLRFRFLSM